MVGRGRHHVIGGGAQNTSPRERVTKDTNITSGHPMGQDNYVQTPPTRAHVSHRETFFRATKGTQDISKPCPRDIHMVALLFFK